MSTQDPAQQSLWFRVQSDEFSVSTPKRFRKLVRFYPADRLVRIEPLLLHHGVFAGAARACQLRLEGVPNRWPQFALRFSRSFQVRLMGFGCDVYYNGYELGEGTQSLKLDDTIICDPYLLRVVPKPTEFLQDLVERVISVHEEDPDHDDTADSEEFLLTGRE